MAYLTSFEFNPTGDPIIDVATQGSAWDPRPSQTISWSLADGFNGEFWTDPSESIDRISQALNIIQNYINVDFEFAGYYADPVVAGDFGADLVYSLDGFGTFTGSAWAVGNFPVVNYGYQTQPGDIFLNINSDANYLDSFEPGSQGFFLILHETFHALGLKHTFDKGGTGRPTLSEIGLGEFDKDWFSVMSYGEDFPLNLLTWDPATPMLLDVLGLQYLYGANLNANVGDTTYTLTKENFYATVWDAGGIDMVDLSQADEGWSVVLPNSQLSDLVPIKAGFAIPSAQGDLPSPTNFFWLTGDLENVLGSAYGDEIFGNDLNNWIRGAAGDDVIYASKSSDVLEGGSGNDTVIYSGNQSSYTLTLSPTATTVTDRRPDGNGTDTLTDMELLDFNSGDFDPFDLEAFGGPSGLDPVELESFIELYIAYFNRAPDAVGLNFWGTQFANGTSLEEMAALFAPQDETLATYPPGTSNGDFATAVYNNVLGRDPDLDGFNFWVGQLDEGNFSRDQFILEVLGGVNDGSPDRDYLDSKVDIGAYFAVHKGMSDVDDAAAAMALFGDQDTSDTTGAEAAIDGYHADALDPDTGEFLMPLVGVLDDPFAMA